MGNDTAISSIDITIDPRTTWFDTDNDSEYDRDASLARFSELVGNAVESYYPEATVSIVSSTEDGVRAYDHDDYRSDTAEDDVRALINGVWGDALWYTTADGVSRG